MVTLAGDPVHPWPPILEFIKKEMNLEAANIVVEVPEGAPPPPSSASFTNDAWWTIKSQVIDDDYHWQHL
jgi:hypothetical protein